MTTNHNQLENMAHNFLCTRFYHCMWHAARSGGLAVGDSCDRERHIRAKSPPHAVLAQPGRRRGRPRCRASWEVVGAAASPAVLEVIEPVLPGEGVLDPPRRGPRPEAACCRSWTARSSTPAGRSPCRGNDSRSSDGRSRRAPTLAGSRRRSAVSTGSSAAPPRVPGARAQPQRCMR